MMTTSERYSAVAGGLEIAFPGAHVALVNGGQAGFWIEVETAAAAFTTSDVDGNWGVTGHVYDQRVAANYCERSRVGYQTFATELSDTGVTAYWTRMDDNGPDADAPVLTICAYVVREIRTGATPDVCCLCAAPAGRDVTEPDAFDAEMCNACYARGPVDGLDAAHALLLAQATL